MKGLLVFLAIFGLAATIGPLSVNLFNYGLGQLTGGLPSLAANCPNKKGACIINGIQSAIGIGLIGLSGVGAFTGSFKREDRMAQQPYSVMDFNVHPLHQDSFIMEAESVATEDIDRHTSFMEQIYGKHDGVVFQLKVLHEDGSLLDANYKFSATTNRHFVGVPIAYDNSNQKRTDIDGSGNDLYVYSYDEYNPDYANQLDYTTDVNKQAANDIYGDMMEANADTACIALEGAVDGRLQIANEGDFNSVQDDCEGTPKIGQAGQYPEGNPPNSYVHTYN